MHDYIKKSFNIKKYQTSKVFFFQTLLEQGRNLYKFYCYKTWKTNDKWLFIMVQKILQYYITVKNASFFKEKIIIFQSISLLLLVSLKIHPYLYIIK